MKGEGANSSGHSSTFSGRPRAVVPAGRELPPEARDANYSGSCEQFVEYRGQRIFNNPRTPPSPWVFTSVANTAVVMWNARNYLGITG